MNEWPDTRVREEPEEDYHDNVFWIFLFSAVVVFCLLFLILHYLR